MGLNRLSILYTALKVGDRIARMYFEDSLPPRRLNNADRFAMFESACERAYRLLGVGARLEGLEDSTRLARGGYVDGGAVLQFNPAFRLLHVMDENEFQACAQVVALHEVGHLLYHERPPSWALELDCDAVSGAGARLLGTSQERCLKFVESITANDTHPPTPLRVEAFLRGWSNPTVTLNVAREWRTRQAIQQDARNQNTLAAGLLVGGLMLIAYLHRRSG
ncbi:MAG: hypothetical protein AMXMBFR7_49200 [Planctomycetota bacterium]